MRQLLSGVILAMAALALLIVACQEPPPIVNVPLFGARDDIGVMDVTCYNYSSNDTPAGIPVQIEIQGMTAGQWTAITTTIVLTSPVLADTGAWMFIDNWVKPWEAGAIAGSGRITVTFSSNVSGNPIANDEWPYEDGPYSFVGSFSNNNIYSDAYLDALYAGDDDSTIEKWDLTVCMDAEPEETPTPTPTATTDPTQMCIDAFHVFRWRDRATATPIAANCGNQVIPTIAPSFGLTWHESSAGYGTTTDLGFFVCGNAGYDGYIIDWSYSGYYQGSGTTTCSTPNPLLAQAFSNLGGPAATPVPAYSSALFTCGQLDCGGGQNAYWEGRASQPLVQRMVLQPFGRFWESEPFGGTTSDACGIPGFLIGDVSLTLVGCIPLGSGLTPPPTLTPAGTDTPLPALPLLTETPFSTFTPTATLTPVPPPPSLDVFFTEILSSQGPTPTPRPTRTPTPTPTATP